MQNIVYLSSLFVRENTMQYILSIRYSADGLSFCVHNSLSQLLLFNHIPLAFENDDFLLAKLKSLIVDDENLMLPYAKVYVISCSDKKMLIPTEISNSKDAYSIFASCMPLDKNETIISQELPKFNVYMLEALPKDFEIFLYGHFTNLVVLNSSFLFISHAASIAPTKEESMFIDIHAKYFELLVMKGSKILFFNTFKYVAVADIVYHSLNVIKQQGIVREHLKAHLSGNLITDLSLMSTFTQYIVRPIVFNDLTPLANEVKTNNISSFIYLLNAHKCEL